MTKPVISCIIPTFNRADLLKNAIESTINQSYKNWELLIIDDNSKDNTKVVVKEYINKDNRIKYYSNPGKGGSAARNFGIKNASGEYIAFLDDDDISLPHRFNTQLDAARNSGSGFIVSGYRTVNKDTGTILSEQKLELKGEGAGFPSRWLLKKELIDIAGGFNESFPSMQDIEISYRLARHEKFVLHDKIVSILNMTYNSVSRNKENSLRGKVMLMEQAGDKMLPVEAAWWYFITGLEYYKLSDIVNTKENIKKAFNLRKSFLYRMGYIYSSFIPVKTGLLKKINVRILLTIANYNFPLLIDHPVVK